MVKHILVTGASAGIGLALCKLLIRDHDCYVYLGSRNVEKGRLTLQFIYDDLGFTVHFTKVKRLLKPFLKKCQIRLTKLKS